MSNLTTPITLTATQYQIVNLNIDVLSSSLTVVVQLLSSSSGIVDTKRATDTRQNFGISGTTQVNQLLGLVTNYLSSQGIIN